MNAYFSERLKTLHEALTADWIGIFPRDASGKLSEPIAFSADLPLARVPHSGNIADCARVGRSLIVHHSVEVRSALAQPKTIRGQAVIPIYFGPRQIGVLDCESAQEAFFTAPRVEELEAFAAQIGALWAWDSADETTRVAVDRKIDELKRANATFDWCGIYRVQSSQLLLSSFRGTPTPHPIISSDEGICGAAVRENQVLNIADVKADPRYLSCDARTRSELVVPIRDAQGRAVAEIDIDSHTPNAFGQEQVARVEELARALTSLMVK